MKKNKRIMVFLVKYKITRIQSKKLCLNKITNNIQLNFQKLKKMKISISFSIYPNLLINIGINMFPREKDIKKKNHNKKIRQKKIMSKNNKISNNKKKKNNLKQQMINK